MAQNVKKVASKNLKKPKVAENSKSCQNSKKLPKISKVAEKLPSNLWLSLPGGKHPPKNTQVPPPPLPGRRGLGVLGMYITRVQSVNLSLSGHLGDKRKGPL